MPIKTGFLQSLKVRSPAILALFYAIFGTVWISANATLLLDLNDNPVFNALIDLLFVVLSSMLLYLLLRKRAAPAIQQAALPKLKARVAYIVASFLCLLLIVPVLDLTISEVHTPKIEKNTYKNLRLIAKIKVVQYERWRDSRIGDAEVIAADENFARLIGDFQAGSSAGSREMILERFGAIMKAYEFEGISLLDSQGMELLRRGDAAVSAEMQRRLVQQSEKTGKVQFSDLYLIGNERIQQDIIAPISRQGNTPRIIGFVIIHTGLDRFILPRVLSWPSASSSAEVLIVRQENAAEDIIHTVKGKHQAAITTRPVSTNTSSTYASPMLQGTGYHGKQIFTVQEPLSDSDWKITTQVDRDEVMEPLHTLLLWVSAVTLAATGIVALALLLLWRQQQRSYQLELLSESNARDRLLKRFYDLPFIGMGVSDPVNGRWLQVNDRLCEIFGYTREKLLQMTLYEITHPEDLAANINDFKSFLRSEMQRFARDKRYLHKNGNIIATRTEVDCTRAQDGSIEMLLVMVEDITERKEAEQALQKSEERLALVLKGSNDGWWDLDLINSKAYHSPRWWGMLGYEAGQDNRDPLLWQKLTHPDDIESTLTYLRKVLAGDEVSYEIELRLQHKAGHYVPILTKGYILRNGTGQAVRISGTNTDLTERKQAEQALRLQEEFNRVLLENLVDGVVACDAKLNLVLFNQTARQWHGMDATRVPRQQWGSYFGLYDADGVHELTFDQIPLVRAYRGETLHHVGMSIKALGQSTRFITCSAAGLYDSTGKQLGAVAIMRDITQNLRHTQILRDSETLYREMFEANPHPMWVFDLETNAFLNVNNAAISHYGWSREEFLSMTIFDVRPQEEHAKLHEHLPQLSSDDLIRSDEWRHKKKDGSEILVEITSHPLIFSGRNARLVTVFDITARKRDEIEIRTLNRLLLMLTNINQAIVRRLNPVELFQEACTIAVRDGGFRMAWIGLIEEDDRHVKPVASMGEVGDYLENINIDLQDPALNEPTIRAIREGHHAISHDVIEDESSRPWREKAFQWGYRGIVALPLTVNGSVIGNFSLYSSEVGVFNEREMNLLDKLAGDISFALEVAKSAQHKLETEQALEQSEALFQTLASTAPVGILRTDLNGNTLYVNASACIMAGLKPGKISPADWTQATHPDDRKRVQAEWKKAVRSQRGFSLEYRFLHPNGNITWVKGQAAAEKNSDGNFTGFVGTITDITALKASEESLRMSAAVFENTREGVMVTDADNRILMVNRAFSEISRYNELDAIGEKPTMLASGRHDRAFYHEMWHSLNEAGHWQGEIWNRRKDGDIHPVLMSISAIKNKAGQIMNYVGVFADISNLKASEAQLEFLAHHDPLTRLPNRLMLISRLDHAIEVSRRANTHLALLMLDLDRFKNVNDSFGHLAGDELLQQVAQRLTGRLRGVDTVTRLGGDEFTVLLQNMTQTDDAARVAQDIIKTLEAPWRLSNQVEVRLSASIGISLYPDHASNAHELLQHADAALYQAKAAGRGCARYFSESLTLAARDRFNLEARLREAIPRNELSVHYQPKIDIASGRTIGAEALVRWQDPAEGLILPARFISIAEETGLISIIGEWMMNEACLQGKRWLDAGLPPLSMAINLSAHQLHHSDIVETLSAVLARTDFPPQLLELELTESILMQREAEIIETLNALRTMGISLAIDDFGTGYSSLAYLKSFPLDILKIDKSFVHDIETDQDDRAITATIIGIAHTLGLQVVAEGVETEEQLAFLRTHECDIYQGYLVSPPVPAEQFVEFIKSRNADQGKVTKEQTPARKNPARGRTRS
jgi:diguanylate cyclase (GGDEF)-like protein/PAS domain S-box-containing protein